jgi:hypothetical protein
MESKRLSKQQASEQMTYIIKRIFVLCFQVKYINKQLKTQNTSKNITTIFTFMLRVYILWQNKIYSSKTLLI